jgi:hypothetical protein
MVPGLWLERRRDRVFLHAGSAKSMVCAYGNVLSGVEERIQWWWIRCVYAHTFPFLPIGFLTSCSHRSASSRNTSRGSWFRRASYTPKQMPTSHLVPRTQFADIVSATRHQPPPPSTDPSGFHPSATLGCSPTGYVPLPPESSYRGANVELEFLVDRVYPMHRPHQLRVDLGTTNIYGERGTRLACMGRGLRSVRVGWEAEWLRICHLVGGDGYRGHAEVYQRVDLSVVESSWRVVSRGSPFSLSYLL